ncbi:MAG: hypothetical protein ACM3SM_06950 [Bacteroidota bacterium]
MGFSTLIDLFGSAIIGGVIFLILLRMSDAATENTYFYAGELLVQEDLVAVVELMEYDFRKIGYCADYTQIPNPSEAILQADSTSISFLFDTNYNGTPDTLRYYLGTTSELSSTPNPRDRMLYRVINNAVPKGANLGVTEFKITYFNALGDKLTFPISDTREIYSLLINIKVENSAAYDAKYSRAFWRQLRLAARNLRNR